jgi:hypothetical protein
MMKLATTTPSAIGLEAIPVGWEVRGMTPRGRYTVDPVCHNRKGLTPIDCLGLELEEINVALQLFDEMLDGFGDMVCGDEPEAVAMRRVILMRSMVADKVERANELCDIVGRVCRCQSSQSIPAGNDPAEVAT